jgi:hypothetical protein
VDVAVGLGVAALAAAFVVPATIEWLKRPRLEIVPSPWAPAGPVAWTFAAVRIRNKPLTWPFHWLLTREAAQGLEVQIDFFTWSSGERAMSSVPGRWSSTPQPLRSVPSPPPQTAAQLASTGGTAVLDPNYQSFKSVYDPDLIRRQHDVPVTRGGEEVAVAILRAGEAFAFTDSSYGHPAWGQPELRLQRGTYRVVVRVHGSSIDHTQAFKLEYLSDDFTSFRLEPA